MNLKCDIKNEYLEIYGQQFQDEEILAAVVIDIDDNMYNESGIVIVNNEYISSIYKNEFKSYKITDCMEFKAEVHVGQGTLEIRKEPYDIEICRFSMDNMAKYSAICKELNKKIKGGKMDFSNSEPERRCDKCGRILPEGTRVCIKCVNKKDTFLKLIKLIDKKYIPSLLLCLFFMLAGSALSLISPYLYKVLINDIFLKQSKDYALFGTLIAGIVILQIIMVLFEIIRGRVATKISNGISHDLRRLVFNKIESLPLTFINTKKTGDLMHRVSHDTDRIRNFVQNDLLRLLSQATTLIFVTVLLFIMNWKMALLIIVPVPAMLIALYMFRKKTRGIYRIQHRLSARADSILQDIISGIRIVKAFGKEENEIARYQKASRDFADRNIYNEKLWATIFPILNFLLSFGTYFIYLYGGSQILSLESNIGELTQFTTYAHNIYAPLGFMAHLPRIISNTAAAAGRIFEILEEDSLGEEENKTVPSEIKGNVRIENISFGYKSYLDVLENITLDVKAGEMIGLCGHSGSGKSTLINLIMNLYKVESGAIYIDGINIDDIDTDKFRSQIGVVLQETYLFSGTIRDNIAFSKTNATDEEIIAAAKIANAHDFITEFPDGYNTRIGERGHNVSGGEKQRIAIARAIIHDPKILILDEATSALDTDTEFLIQEALGRLVKGRTTFAIAHRLSTLKNADRLVVLDHGKIAETGTHEELIEKKSLYYNLVMAQKEMSKLSK